MVVLDLAAGAILTGLQLLPPADRGDLRASVIEAVQVDVSSPVLASEPWAQEYGENLAAHELQNRPYSPFLVRDMQPFDSTYVNTTDRERVSYEPTGPDGVRPLSVAFFGGSVMFGVGQRDDHTIPSEFARIAEDDGIPLEVHNYGLPGWVSWQEFQYLERLLAEGESFDLVIFLDGFNEFEIQRTDFSTDPTHNGAAALEEILADFSRRRATEPGVFDALNELSSSYRRSSAIWRIGDTLTGREVPLPGANPVSVDTDRQQEAALDIYSRSTGGIENLASDYRAPVQFFWQPRRAGWSADIIDRLPPEVTDLSGVFDNHPDELYFDHVHTNEIGAHLLAEAMWAEVGPDIVARTTDR